MADTTELTKEQKIQQSFGIRLKRQMLKHGLRTSDMSEMTGMTPQCVSRYIAGGRMPSLYNVALLAQAVGCTIDELVDYDILEKL